MLLNIFVRTALYSAMVALAFAPLESISPQHNRVRSDYKRDVGYALLGATAAQFLALWLMGLCLTGAEYIGFSEGPLHQAPTWVSLIASILWVEFSGYGYHRLAHHVPLLWKLHKTHHSSETMDWLASFRQHPVEIALMTLVQNVPLVLLGLSLSEHTLLILVLRLNTVFVHANIRVPLWWPRALFATPAFHHRHHALSGSTTNFASLFPWIDRIFGSFSTETATAFGLAPADTRNTQVPGCEPRIQPQRPNGGRQDKPDLVPPSCYHDDNQNEVHLINMDSDHRTTRQRLFF